MQARKKDNKILLHACCAICCAHPINLLRELGYEPVVYFYNPNIQPESEYLKRLEAQKMLCGSLNCELIVAPYNPQEFFDIAKGLENEPERGKRCEKCFELRLNHTAQKAKELGIKDFTTSIVISPHKDFSLLEEIGKQISKNYLSIDFKKKDGFLKTNKIAKELGLYRQTYCGCQHSNSAI